MLVGCGKEEKPQEAFDTYTKAWNKTKNLQKCMINYQKRQKKEYFKERIH